MFFYEGLSCPVCGKAFEDHEDIVSCPVCGAPHHRDCWKSEGHCHFEDKHGTAEQWSRESAETKAADADDMRRCPHCGAENSPFVEFCGHCGRPIEGQAWSSGPSQEPRFQTPPTYGEYAPYRINPFNQYGGVDKDAVIADVSAEDLAAVVVQNTPYYLPRFKKMDEGGGSVSFNWAAFLFTPYWLMFRKSYLFGALTLLFNLLSTVITSYVSFVKLGWSADLSAVEMYNQIQSIMYTNSSLAKYLYLITGLTFVSILIQVFFGLFGNRLYLQTCVRRINRLQDQSPTTYKTQLGTVGGVSLGLAMLAALLTRFVPLVVLQLLIN